MIPDSWLLDYPTFHFWIAVIALIVLIIVVLILRREAKNSAKLDILIAQLVPIICPCCHEKTLVTVRRCTSPKCRSITILEDQKGHSSALPFQPIQHVSGD